MSEVGYSGPQFPDASLVTLDELHAGTTQAPPGTEPHEVLPGQNLSQIARDSGYASLEQLLAYNPQYADRNPDLIYPGEIVFVPKSQVTEESQATDQALQDLEQAEQAAQAHSESVAAGEPGVSGSDQGHYNQAVTSASGQFDAAAIEEIDAGIDYASGNSRADFANSALESGEAIAQRLENQGRPEAAERVRELAQQRADEINNEI